MSSIVEKFNLQIFGAEENPLLFVNGFGCSQKVWRHITDDFSTDHQIILFDHVGTGGASVSAFNEEKYSDLSGYADDIIEICKFLEIEDVTLIGHSIGSMMGVLAATKYPKLFKSLVLVTPSPRHLNDMNYEGGISNENLHDLLSKLDSSLTDWSEIMAPMIAMNEDRPQLSQELVDMFCSLPNDVVGVFAKTTFMNDSREYLKHISQPTLVIQTREDKLVPPQVTQLLLNEIPNAQVKFIDAEGHCPHFSHSDLLVGAIKSFLKK